MNTVVACEAEPVRKELQCGTEMPGEKQPSARYERRYREWKSPQYRSLVFSGGEKREQVTDMVRF